MFYPLDRKHDYRVKTNVKGITAKRVFGVRLTFAADDAVAADTDGVLAANLTAEEQEITEGITNPAIPRALSVVGNVAGVVGNVVITGTNYANEVITETIALNETTAVHGAKAFKTITKIELPERVHTPVAQVETATAAGTVTTAGNAAVTVTTALLEKAEVVAVPVEVDDDANAIALAIRTALATNDNIAAHFDVSGEDAAVILTAKVPAANDPTLNIAIADGEGDGASEGVTTVASSADTTPGVPYDIVSVGWNDKLGLPYLLPHNTVQAAYLNNVKETNASTVATDADDIEGNTIDLHSALNGTAVDVYLIV